MKKFFSKECFFFLLRSSRMRGKSRSVLPIKLILIESTRCQVTSEFLRHSQMLDWELPRPIVPLSYFLIKKKKKDIRK